MTDKIKLEGYVPLEQSLIRDVAQGYAEMLFALTKTQNAFFVLQPLVEDENKEWVHKFDLDLHQMINFLKTQFQVMSAQAIMLEKKSED